MKAFIQSCLAWIFATESAQRLLKWAGIITYPVAAVRQYEKEISELKKTLEISRSWVDCFKKQNDEFRQQLWNYEIDRRQLDNRNCKLVGENSLLFKQIQDLVASRAELLGINETQAAEIEKLAREMEDIPQKLAVAVNKKNTFLARYRRAMNALIPLRKEHERLKRTIQELEGVVRYYEIRQLPKERQVAQEYDVPETAPVGGYVPRNMPRI